MTKRKSPRFNTKDKPKKEPEPDSHLWTIILVLVLLIGAGLYFSGFWNGPTGKLHCTDAEIAANVACR